MVESWSKNCPCRPAEQSARRPEDLPVIVGCGVMAKEIHYLITKNGWEADTDFMPPSLHGDPEALAAGLSEGLARRRGRPRIVFYGGCHPQMADILQMASTFRMVGRSCVEMLLGREVYQREFANGAFFLLEDWAERWAVLGNKDYGPSNAVAGGCLPGDRRFLLGVRTPCSGDFSNAAGEVSRKTGLPLLWIDAGLDRLELALRSALKRSKVEAT